VDWINPTGVKKVHSLTDKVYRRKNLEMAWETVKANRGSGAGRSTPPRVPTGGLDSKAHSEMFLAAMA
jgi:hypothetical protein